MLEGLELGRIDTWLALVSLSAMEIVLGIDNVVFLALIVGKLPVEERERVRKLGVGLALFTRVGLLFTLSWLMGLHAVLATVFGHGVTGRDLVLLFGGLFLVYKSSHELYLKVECKEEPPPDPDAEPTKKRGPMALLLLQIVLVDILFSLDSVVTAVGMANRLWTMIAAMMVAVLVMFFASKLIGDFVERHPSVKILALAFLLLIGVMLVVEAFGVGVPKGYVYFAMAFGLGIECLNMRLRANVARLESASSPRQ